MLTAREARARATSLQAIIEKMKVTVSCAIQDASDDALLEVAVALPGGRYVIRVVEWLEEKPRKFKVHRTFTADVHVLHISW